MFNVEMKHGQTQAWIVRAQFDSRSEAEQFAYQQTEKYTNEYRVTVGKTGEVVTDGYKARY